ncbi:hypothetical protein D3C73_1132630 [compost metagenome]
MKFWEPGKKPMASLPMPSSVLKQVCIRNPENGSMAGTSSSVLLLAEKCRRAGILSPSISSLLTKAAFRLTIQANISQSVYPFRENVTA